MRADLMPSAVVGPGTVADEAAADVAARLLDIAERCPVHRTLHSEVLVSTAESGPDGPGG